VKTKKEWTSQRLCRFSVAGHTGMSLMGVAKEGGPSLEGLCKIWGGALAASPIGTRAAIQSWEANRGEHGR
jgi:hypothetical protein